MEIKRRIDRRRRKYDSVKDKKKCKTGNVQAQQGRNGRFKGLHIDLQELGKRPGKGRMRNEDK